VRTNSLTVETGRVKLPRSATRRGALTWAKLLTRVDAKAQNGFGFEGRIVRPGALIGIHEMPEPAVVLECAGNDGSGRGHRRAEDVYILWRYDRRRGEWAELARARSVNWEWALDLRPIARRALEGPPPNAPEERTAIARVLNLVDAEIEGAGQQTLLDVMAALHDRLAARVAEKQEGVRCEVLGVRLQPRERALTTPTYPA
jgi:hypothetical protein